MGTRTVRRPDVEEAGRRGVETAARVGYAARGVVYGIIGLLALMLALGRGGRTTGTKGAVQELAQQPLGGVLVALTGVGLLGFAAWRFVQAIKDTEGRGRSPKGWAMRAGYVGSGLIHASLGVFCFRLLAGDGGGRGEGTKSFTAQLMSQPFGQVLVALVGAGVIGFGLRQLQRAWTGSALKKLSLSGLAAQKRTQVERIVRAGVAARGVVFLLMGIFFLRAALEANPGEARGLGESLATLARQPFGQWLLGLVALGLVAYAVYQLLTARYRRIATA